MKKIKALVPPRTFVISSHTDDNGIVSEILNNVNLEIELPVGIIVKMGDYEYKLYNSSEEVSKMRTSPDNILVNKGTPVILRRTSGCDAKLEKVYQLLEYIVVNPNNNTYQLDIKSGTTFSHCLFPMFFVNDDLVRVSYFHGSN